MHQNATHVKSLILVLFVQMLGKCLHIFKGYSVKNKASGDKRFGLIVIIITTYYELVKYSKSPTQLITAVTQSLCDFILIRTHLTAV